MINGVATYRNYYKFKARIYLMPNSFNRIGVDLYPRFFMRPTELIEVMAYSDSAGSTDDGFEKDQESGLYLKDRSEINDTVTYDEIDIQFLYIKIRPPYWYHDEASFVEFIQINMDTTRQTTYESLYNSAASKSVVVNAEENPDIPVNHAYKELTQWTTRTFNKEIAKDWPIEKGVIISKVS